MTRTLDPSTVSRYREQEFPITRRWIHLNHASVAPTSVRVAEAASSWLRNLAEEADDEHAWESGVELGRERFARLIGSTPQEIAFVRNTSHGLSLIAEGVAWRPGDRIAVATEIEYPSNVHPWKRKASELGHDVLEVPHRHGVLDMERLAEVLKTRPRLLAVSSAQYASGAVTDLVELGRMCHASDVLFCVDAIQTLGALPIDVREAQIDFLSADGHKWLLGMPGVGVLYVASERVAELRPALIGWKSMVDGWEFDSRYDTLLPDASRFEEGSPSYALIEGLSAAAELLLEVSVEAVAERVTGLVKHLVTGLESLDCDIRTPREARRHIVSFTPPGLSLDTADEELRKHGVIASVRAGGLRVAPHFYNTESEIDRFVSVVRSLVS